MLHFNPLSSPRIYQSAQNAEHMAWDCDVWYRINEQRGFKNNMSPSQVKLTRFKISIRISVNTGVNLYTRSFINHPLQCIDWVFNCYTLLHHYPISFFLGFRETFTGSQFLFSNSGSPMDIIWTLHICNYLWLDYIVFQNDNVIVGGSSGWYHHFNK